MLSLILNPRTGRVVLEFGGRIAGGGLILATDGVGAQIGSDLASLAARLNRELIGLSPSERIARFRVELPGRIVFTTSFGLEDQVLTHQLAQTAAVVEVATLDAGASVPQT